MHYGKAMLYLKRDSASGKQLHSSRSPSDCGAIITSFQWLRLKIGSKTNLSIDVCTTFFEAMSIFDSADSETRTRSQPMDWQNKKKSLAIGNLNVLSFFENFFDNRDFWLNLPAWALWASIFFFSRKWLGIDDHSSIMAWSDTTIRMNEWGSHSI